MALAAQGEDNFARNDLETSAGDRATKANYIVASKDCSGRNEKPIVRTCPAFGPQPLLYNKQNRFKERLPIGTNV